MVTKDDAKRPAPDAIDAHLKKAFASLAGEPMPDRFEVLLAQLRAQETGAKGSNGNRGGAAE